MPREYRTEPLTIRITPTERRLIDAAAQAAGDRISDVVRDAALGAARQILARLAAPGDARTA